MNLIICVDDDGGRMFAGRRQSRDAALCERVSAIANGRLWVSEYSAGLFADAKVDNDMLSKAGDGEWCFAEDADISSAVHRAEKIVIYRWNRRYPSDVKLPEDALCGRELIASDRFEGKSHKTITEEIYR